MATIVPQMAKLSVKDLLETRQRLEADILKMLEDFEARTGVSVYAIEVERRVGWALNALSPQVAVQKVSVEFDL